MNQFNFITTKLQSQIRRIDKEAAEWKQNQEKQLNSVIRSESSASSQQIRIYKEQLADLEAKKTTINKYYGAYFSEASAGVQKSTSAPPVPVNMNLYKNQLVNPNKKQAADIIVTMARSHLAYLKNQEKELNEKIQAVEGTGKSSVEALEKLDQQLQATFKPRYLNVLASNDMVTLSKECIAVTKKFASEDWETYRYSSPLKRSDEIMVGSLQRTLRVPEYLKESAAMYPVWKANQVTVPVCIPLNGFHMLVNYHVTQAMATKEGIRTMIGNLLKHMPAGSVKVYPFDLETFQGGAFGGLIHLASNGPAFLAPVPENEGKVLETLRTIYEECTANAEKMTGFRTLDEYNAQAEEGKKLTQKILVVYGCPERLSGKALEYFERLYYMSEQYGISIVAIHNAHSDIGASAAKTFYQNMREDALIIDCGPEGQYITSGGEKATFRWLRGLNTLSEETLQTINEIYGSFIVEEDRGEEEELEAYFREITHTRGNRHLSLAFGINENKKIETFDFEEMNFAAYISGSAGCGKSSLMHTLIGGILTHCHPENVELWLVDFKMTEFQLYAKHMPPHVKRVILESSEEVVLDLIDELTDLLEHRTKLFSKYGFKDILKLPQEFRMKHLPLVIVMVDEFATMTQIVRNAPMAGNLSYAEKLENLLAKGRALGFRFVFADQAYEAGVSGLTTKAKNQIGCRFAMANVSQEEMRGTLAIPSGAMTDEVHQWMATLPPYHALTSEKEGVEGTLEQVIRVHRSKVAFLSQEALTEIIFRLNQKYSPVKSSKELTETTYLDKNPLVVDGQRVYTFKEIEPVIASWDKAQDYPQEIQRLYLGQPCALRKVAPVELKPAPGENLLLISETPELVVSEALSAMRSVSSKMMEGSRDRSNVTVLAYYLEPIYRKFRKRWEKQNCITDMEDICETISQLRQKVEKNQSGDELIVVLGLYNLFQEWEELPKKKPSGSNRGQDWLSDFDVPDIYSVKPVKMSDTPSPLVSMLGGMIDEDEDDEDLDDDLDLLELTPLSDEEDEAKKFGDDEYAEEGDLLYNAIEDFRYLLTKGPAKGYHFLVIMNQYSEYKELKFQEKMFRHLVYEWLAKEELSDIIGYGRSARIPSGAIRYVSKRDAFSLRPYLWSGLTINGWTMDENGNAVEAGDEDDEFI
ncbi:MAG: hypothetical protein IJ486_09805 [Firmicutes bacterium]|nr:hypothetical protein [Bacillota bacterium]